MKRVLYILALIAIGGTLVSYQWYIAKQPTLSQAKVKNVILMVGDGMGLTQISAGMYATDKPLQLERAQFTGLMKTHSASSKITDSAAGATAFASGVKTYNGGIGVNADTVSVPTILEMAEQQGLKTGLIASCALSHATPASFYTHNHTRARIGDSTATDFMKSGIEVFIGGGRDYFNKRNDSADYYSQLPAMGYTVLDTIVDKLPKGVEKLVCLDAPTHLVSVENGRGDFLPIAVEKGLKVLNTKNESGFFMMVEGSQIDWGGHDNNSSYIISEMLDFDKAIGEVLDFAEKDGNTLVIITADHETGGYAINGFDSDADTVKGAFTTGYHTATMVPVFSFGPGAEQFTGIIDNTDIFHKMVSALDLKEAKK